MTQENNINDNTELDNANDTTGLAEIEKALQEIEKLEEQREAAENQSDDSIEPEVEKEEDREVTEETPTPPKEKGKRDWKELKKLYGAQAEIDRLRYENEELRRSKENLEHTAKEALNVGTYHYGKGVYNELEAAKIDKARALEEADAKALIEADIRINRAVNKIDELERWGTTVADEPRQDRTPVSNYPAPSQTADFQQQIAHEWLEAHPYLQTNSDNYDQNLATKVKNFVNQLDSTLMNHGRPDIYYTPEYFDTIDNQIEKFKTQLSRGNQTLESSSYVGGVRNSGSNSIGRTSNTTKVLLTADEKRMAFNAGIKEEEWLKYKIRDLQKKKA